MVKNLFKNISLNLFQSVFNLLSGFIIRILVLRYVGVLLIGVNATLTSVVNTMALTEMGFSTVIIYYLYDPILKRQSDKINEILSVFCGLYRIIAGLIGCLSLVLYPFLEYILKGVEITNEIKCIYWILVCNAICTYLLSYRKIILEADQKQYITKRTEIYFDVIGFFLQIIVLVKYGNYCIFLLCVLVKNILSNTIIHFNCKRVYPFLKKAKVSIYQVKKVIVKCKDAMMIRIASYVYVSTDNLIISSFINTMTVGYYSNYTQIYQGVSTLVRAVLYTINPSMGNAIADNKGEDVDFFYTYSRIAFVVECIFLLPTFILINLFIGNFYGSEFIMEIGISLFLYIDLLLDSIQIPLCSYLVGCGMFKVENRNCFIGATVNIVVSITLVNYFGIYGVLAGTIVSQCIYLLLRSYAVFNKIYKNEMTVNYRSYFVDLVKQVVVIILATSISYGFVELICLKNWIVKFFIGFVSVELVYIFLYMIFWGKDRETQKIINVLFRKE